MFEATSSALAEADADAVWALWADPGRWPEWNQQVERAEADGELAPGTPIRVKLRRGGTLHQRVTELEPGRLLVTEARLPGAKQVHEHRVEPRGGGAEISHRLRVRGPLWPLFALLLGRKRMRRAVEDFAARERELAS